jgi:Na+-translocating ferredoxin:NAD+ oxidoreductase RNF subunit RnfB
MFGEEVEKTVPGSQRVILALANHAQTAGWDRAKELQRAMFKAAGSGLEMKFAFYGADNAAGVRHCRITTRWISDPDDMAAVMDRAECGCGCYVNICDVLAQAVKEAEERPLRAVIIVGDAFHDDPDGLDEAAISANRLRRAGTRVFLMQLGDDLITARRLQYLARVSGGAYFRFDPRRQER